MLRIAVAYIISIMYDPFELFKLLNDEGIIWVGHIKEKNCSKK